MTWEEVTEGCRAQAVALAPLLQGVQALRDVRYLAALVEKYGVTFGVEPVDPHEGDCAFCVWHVFVDGQEVDGGTTSAVHGWITEGYIKGDQIVLRPVRPQGTTRPEEATR